MSERGPVIYGVEYQGRALTARALTARTGETEKIQFLCGTQSLQHENQVHLLDYNEDTGVLDKVIFMHPAGEVWHIAACPSPSHPHLLTTVYSSVRGGEESVRGAGVWKVEGEEEGDQGRLEEVCTLTHDGTVKCTAWQPSSSAACQLASLDEKTATLWKIDQADAQALSSIQLDSKGRCHSYSSLCWNPHHSSHQLLCTSDASLHGWDTRSDKLGFTLDSPHGPCVRDVDYNPNKPYVFVSCGDDCCVKFWDSRQLKTPLLTRQDHSHWIWSVQYNLFHDQLLLSASSDSRVILTRLPSVASEPLRHEEEEEDEEEQRKFAASQVDEVLRSYDEHEDSVYSVVWSSADAWVFASLSYDGRLVINHVPTQEKFAILTS